MAFFVSIRAAELTSRMGSCGMGLPVLLPGERLIVKSNLA